MEWNDSYSVGVKEMDEQHKKWIAIINELNEAMRTGKAQDALAAIFSRMSDYVTQHFRAEEELFSKYGYLEAASHKNVHAAYIKKIGQLQQDFKAGKVLMSMQVMDALRQWLTEHIQGQDKKYGAYLNAKGVR